MYDEKSNYYPPTSSLVSNYCDLLRDNNIDVDTPKHEPYVLMRANVKDEMEDIVPLMILNWQPVFIDKEHNGTKSPPGEANVSKSVE